MATKEELEAREGECAIAQDFAALIKEEAEVDGRPADAGENALEERVRRPGHLGGSTGEDRRHLRLHVGDPLLQGRIPLGQPLPDLRQLVGSDDGLGRHPLEEEGGLAGEEEERGENGDEDDQGGDQSKKRLAFYKHVQLAIDREAK